MSIHDQLPDGTRLFKELRRLAGSPFGVEPTFLIIGAQKGGTTSLYSYLAEHPQVGRARLKESHAFTREWPRGGRWRRSQHPHAARRFWMERVRGRRFATGDASPDYLFDENAPRRIREHLPDVRLVALLREPVDRAYSQYQHMVRRGREALSFEEAIDAEAERLEGLSPDAPPVLYYSYLMRSRYDEQLARWLEYFPREQLLVLQSEPFFRDPAAGYRRVLEHLGLERFEPRRYERRNFHGAYDELDDALRERLLDYFQPRNERLFELIGERFDWPTPSGAELQPVGVSSGDQRPG